MNQAIRIHETGAPERMRLETVDLADPAHGQIRVRHAACGVNFIDVYHRLGVYPLPLPSGLGVEGAGTVDAVGPGVDDLRVGDRVAYATAQVGSYAQSRVLDARTVVRLPEAIDFATAAAMMLKGLTAHYLLKRTQPQGGLQAGDTVLLHAAAGGVGLIVCQWARELGLRVIGTAGGAAKCELARANGAEEMIDYQREDFVARVRQWTGGRGVKVVLDSVGLDTWAGSLDCLQPLGLLVSFGASSGKPPPVDVGVLAAKGSIHLTRPTLFTHLSSRAATQSMADELFAVVADGRVKIRIDQRYPLADAAQAHRDLEARRTTGSSVLLP